MNSRERLWAALSGEQPDRVPIWMLYPRERLNYYADVYKLPSYQNLMPAIWHKTDWLDRRSLPSALFHTAAVDLEQHQVQEGRWTITRRILHTPKGDLSAEHKQDPENAAGAATEYFCKDISDLEKILSIPYEPVDPDTTALHQAAQKLGNAGLMMVDLGMPIGVAYHCTHPETFAIWTLTERDFLEHFTRTMFDRIYTWLHKALVAGAGPVFFCVGTEFVAPPMCSPATFDALITPFDTPLFELIHRYSGKVIVHHHGNIHGLLNRIAELGADAIQPIEEPPVGDCTLKQAKNSIGNQVCIVGSVQYDDFARLT
ncbi:MAG: uroporphyrinogen decarboxylase family protein, partial [Anaerolineae bacterium]|nr:uroporphyrinogen decarboxylase family protein [Anaerolineae bacterium]